MSQLIMCVKRGLLALTGANLVTLNYDTFDFKQQGPFKIKVL